MDSSMFEGYEEKLIIVGIMIGVVLAALVYGAVRLFSHVSIHWVS